MNTAHQFKITLRDVEPPVWRRVLVPSHFTLDQVHSSLQTVMGWSDYHLYQFQIGRTRYCIPDDDWPSESTDPGSTRLGDVVQAGDRFHYLYDFGDGWDHIIEIEDVVPRTKPARAVCLDGRRSCPPEDVGGPGGYAEFLAVLGDVCDERHDEFVNWIGGKFDPDAFAASETDANLEMELQSQNEPETLTHLQRLRDKLQGSPILTLIDQADLGRPALVDTADAAVAVQPYGWLLDRIGDQGVKLTGAGYLPPTVVTEAMGQLSSRVEWIGKANREDLTAPVWELRESAQNYRLLRRFKGSLVLTPTGRKLRGEPVALWHHLASKVLAEPDKASADASALLMAAVAVGQANGGKSWEDVIAAGMTEIGWRVGDDRHPLNRSDAFSLARPAWATMRTLGLLPRRRLSEGLQSPSRAAVQFARAALQSSP